MNQPGSTEKVLGNGWEPIGIIFFFFLKLSGKNLKNNKKVHGKYHQSKRKVSESTGKLDGGRPR